MTAPQPGGEGPKEDYNTSFKIDIIAKESADNIAFCVEAPDDVIALSDAKIDVAFMQLQAMGVRFQKRTHFPLKDCWKVTHLNKGQGLVLKYDGRRANADPRIAGSTLAVKAGSGCLITPIAFNFPLHFNTVAETLRLTSTGILGIGITAPAMNLVSDDTLGLALYDEGSAASGTLKTPVGIAEDGSGANFDSATYASSNAWSVSNGFRVLASGDDSARRPWWEATWISSWPSTSQAVQYAMQTLTQSGAGVALDVINDSSLLWGTNPTPVGNLYIQGTPYVSTTLSAIGGTTPYLWSLTGGSLPAGLTFSSTGTHSENEQFLAISAASKVASITEARGNAFSFTSDAGGNVASVTDPIGNTATYSYSYDALNRLVSVTDARGNSLLFTYDADGNVASVIDPLGNTATYSYSYDALNRLASSTAARGIHNSYAYDAAKLISVANPIGTSASFTYDAASNLISVTDPIGNPTFYAYDQMPGQTGHYMPLSVSVGQTGIGLSNSDGRYSHLIASDYTITPSTATSVSIGGALDASVTAGSTILMRASATSPQFTEVCQINLLKLSGIDTCSNQPLHVTVNGATSPTLYVQSEIIKSADLNGDGKPNIAVGTPLTVTVPGIVGNRISVKSSVQQR